MEKAFKYTNTALNNEVTLKNYIYIAIHQKCI